LKQPHRRPLREKRNARKTLQHGGKALPNDGAEKIRTKVLDDGSAPVVVGRYRLICRATYLRGISICASSKEGSSGRWMPRSAETGVDIPEGKNLVGAFYHPWIFGIEHLLLNRFPSVMGRNAWPK